MVLEGFSTLGITVSKPLDRTTEGVDLLKYNIKLLSNSASHEAISI